jgi:hypothetical protein
MILTWHWPTRLRARRRPTRPPPAQHRALLPGDHAQRLAHGRAVDHDEHLVAGTHRGAGLGGQLGVAAVDGDDAHLHLRVAAGKAGDGGAGQVAGVGHAHRHQVGAALREAQHLQRLGVFDQLVDVARDRGLGADHAVDREAFLVQQRPALAELGRADARDGGGDAEHRVRHLAGHQVGFVHGGAGDEHVGVLGAGLAHHRRLDAVADDTAQLQPVLQRVDAVGVGVDHGDVVLLQRQAFGHAFAHAAGAKDDDAHGLCP